MQLNSSDPNSCKGFELGSFIENNKAFIMSLAHRYSHTFGAEVEDLFQEGAIGMKIAYDKFDPTCGVKFLTYAYYWCDQRIREYCFKNSSQVQIPKALQIEYYKSTKPANPGEEPRQGNTHLAAMMSSYKNMVRIDSEDTFVQPSYDQQFEQKDSENYSPISKRTKEALKELLDRDEYFILNLRFGLESPKACSLETVGEIIGCTREWARVREKRALDKLRFFFETEDEWIS